MKSTNILLKICLLLGIVTLASCSDYLQVAPSDQLQLNTFYSTPKQIEQGIYGTYADLRYITNDEFLYMSECRSDNAWVNPATDGLREYSEIGTFRAGYDITTFNAVWTEWYKVILDANKVISSMSNVTFTDKALKTQYLGEAYFLRGWAYFELVRLFGNVPIIDKVMLPAEAASVGQSKSIDVLNNIALPDMRKAESYLPLAAGMKTADGKLAISLNLGRADKIAAKAMLGRVYMAMAGFPYNVATATDSAEVKLKGVIDFSTANSNKYWAADSTAWKKQWISENNNTYSIFAIQHRSGGYGNPAIFNFSPALPASYTTMRIFGNQINVEKSLMYEFSKRQTINGKPDSRGYNNSILIGYAAETGTPTPYSNTISPMTEPSGTDSLVYSNTMFYKYFNTLRKRAALGYATNLESTMKDYNDWPVNYPVLRLEDVQLMYAEVLLKKNSDIAGALFYVNKIRQRAGCDQYPTTLNVAQAWDAVKKERRIELMGEGVRWFDLVRWGEWKSATLAKFKRYNYYKVDASNVKDGRYLYPIPQNQMLITPGLYTQNTDY